MYQCPGSVDILLELMTIHREKGVAIFTKCCVLIAIFCYDPARAKVKHSFKHLNCFCYCQIVVMHTLITNWDCLLRSVFPTLFTRDMTLKLTCIWPWFTWYSVCDLDWIASPSYDLNTLLSMLLTDHQQHTPCSRQTDQLPTPGPAETNSRWQTWIGEKSSGCCQEL